jgi:hypothetical protein
MNSAPFFKVTMIKLGDTILLHNQVEITIIDITDDGYWYYSDRFKKNMRFRPDHAHIQLKLGQWKILPRKHLDDNLFTL